MASDMRWTDGRCELADGVVLFAEHSPADGMLVWAARYYRPEKRLVSGEHFVGYFATEREAQVAAEKAAGVHVEAPQTKCATCDGHGCIATADRDQNGENVETWCPTCNPPQTLLSAGVASAFSEDALRKAGAFTMRAEIAARLRERHALLKAAVHSPDAEAQATLDELADVERVVRGMPLPGDVVEIGTFQADPPQTPLAASVHREGETDADTIARLVRERDEARADLVKHQTEPDQNDPDGWIRRSTLNRWAAAAQEYRAENAALRERVKALEGEVDWLTERAGALEEALDEILEYRGGADNALADQFVMERVRGVRADAPAAQTAATPDGEENDHE